MACCKCCCGNADCSEGDQGKCCCGDTCCDTDEYCCGGGCQSDPCCDTDEDCTAPPGEVAECCDGVCKDTLNDTGACYKAATNFETCEEMLYADCGQDNQSNDFRLCEACPP